MLTTTEIFSQVRNIKMLKGFSLINNSDIARAGPMSGNALDTRWREENEKLVGFVSGPPGAPYDGAWPLANAFGDVKLLRFPNSPDGYVYISHNEWLFAQDHSIAYPIYTDDEEDNCVLMTCFSFFEANAAGAVKRFERGTPSFCEATQQLEKPWSIQVVQNKSMWAPLLC